MEEGNVQYVDSPVTVCLISEVALTELTGRYVVIYMDSSLI